MNARNILIGVAVLLAVVIGGGVILITTIDVNDYRALIAEKVQKATGRELKIAGDVELNISLNPSLSVSGVSFANANWGSRAEMVTLDSFSAEVALLPLLFGNIEVNRLVLSGLDVLLETDAKGNGNWLFAGPAANKPDAAKADGGALPTINLVELRDIKFTWRDGRTGVVRKFEIKRFEAQAESASSSLNFNLEASLAGIAISADGRLGPLTQLANPEKPWPLDVKLRAGGATVSLKGTIARPLTAQGLNLMLNVRGEDVAALGPLLGAALPSLGPYALAATLQGGPDDLAVKDLAAKVGGSDIAGDIRLRLGGAKPDIVATLKAGVLNLADFSQGGAAVAAPSKPAPAAKDGQRRLFPDDPLPLDALTAIDARIDLAVNKLMAAGLTIVDIELSAVIKGGKADIALKKAGLSGGSISARAALDGRAGKTGLALDFQVKQLALGTLLKDLGITDILDADLNASAKLSGKGGSVRALMAGLNGRIEATSKNGAIASSYIGYLAVDLLKKMASDSKVTKVNCFVARFAIKDGIATNTALLFDTPNMVVTGTGKIDLRQEKLDLQVRPRPKAASLLSLAVPVNIGGAFTDPTFAPSAGAVALGVASLAAAAINPAALLIPLLSGGSDDKNPCVAALEGVSDARAEPGAASGSSAPPPEKVKEGGLGGFFKKILGD